MVASPKIKNQGQISNKSSTLNTARKSRVKALERTVSKDAHLQSGESEIYNDDECTVRVGSSDQPVKEKHLSSVS